MSLRTEAPALLDLVQVDELQQRRTQSRTPPDEVRRLGAQLKRARIQRGWSLRQFGSIAGLNYETIRRVESGLVDPRWSVVVRLAQILGVNAIDLELHSSLGPIKEK